MTARRLAVLTRPLRVLLIALGLTASGVADGHTAPPCADPAMRFVKIGETVTACLPPSWIDSVARSEIDGAVLLFALWPGLGGFYDGQERSRPYNGQEHGGSVRVLLILSDRLNPLQQRYENLLSLFSPHSRHEPTMGLEHWGRDVPPTRESSTHHEIYYAANSDGQVQRYIDCHLPGTVAAPGCSEETYIGPFLAQISYSRVFLPDWRDIEEGVARNVLAFLQ